MTPHEGCVVRPIVNILLCCSLLGCNGMQAKQDKRMQNFEATQQDFDSIARATFKLIDAKGEVNVIVAPTSLEPRALKALRGVHPTEPAAPGADTLPAGYFRVKAFNIEDGEAHLDGQLGPVTGRMTAANMPDCGKEYSVAFYIEGGDWVNHAYKSTTCSESRHWVPLDEKSPAQ